MTEHIRDSVKFASLKRENFREQARHVLRLEILSGRIPPGVLFSAPDFGRRLGVSATPVREALLDLANEGLVDVIRNRGFRVATVTSRDAAELLELRLMIELPAIREAAFVISEAGLAQVRHLALATEAFASSDDLLSFMEADSAFHLALLRPLGNSRLLSLITRLRDQSSLFVIPRSAGKKTLKRWAADHLAITAALEKQDPDVAEARLRAHIELALAPESDSAIVTDGSVQA